MMHRYNDGLHSYTCEACGIVMLTGERPEEDELDAAERLGVLA